MTGEIRQNSFGYRLLERRGTRDEGGDMSPAYPSVEVIQAAMRLYVVGGNGQAVHWLVISAADNCPERARSGDAVELNRHRVLYVHLSAHVLRREFAAHNK